ncbi:hypothetical protein ZHAS_00006628 [Anopheles sinensis]|uniref:Secreted protein n=1 Tax=Anopheles sinensis TaxID=74873 RepID=A0A084VMT2_ANOSI|nr:hypothetical protein ZHAS_00006628 [Anopheles sinensis]
MFLALRCCTLFGLLGLLGTIVEGSSIQGGSYCRNSGCVTQYGCVPRYSNFRTALYCQQCVIEQCSQRAEVVPERKPCYQLTALASGQRLASRESYDRRTQLRYASVVGKDYQGERDRWNLLVGPGNNYYIQNSDTGEYLRAHENNFVHLVAGRPTDNSFLFKPILVRGSWSCVLFQSVCYGGYIYGEQYSAASNFVLMTQDLQRCYQESLWSVSTVYC